MTRAARQPDKAALGFRQFDHFQVGAVLLGGLSHGLASVALIGIGHLDGLTQSLLDLLA